MVMYIFTCIISIHHTMNTTEVLTIQKLDHILGGFQDKMIDDDILV